MSDTVLVTIMEGDGTFAAVYEDPLASGAGQPTLGWRLLMLLMLAGQNNTVTTRPHFIVIILLQCITFIFTRISWIQIDIGLLSSEETL